MSTTRYVPALGFAALTPFYDAVVRWTTRERTFKSALLDQARIGSGQQVLDVGCGTGTLAIMAAQRAPAAAIAGLDGDPEMLARAREKARQAISVTPAKAGVPLRFDQGFSTSLPYPDATFDVALSSLFFHHLARDDKAKTFAELFRVLRPGGALHVADWGRARNPLMRVAFLGIQLLDGFSTTGDNVRGELPGLMSEAGFTEVAEASTFSTMFGTMSLYRARRSR